MHHLVFYFDPFGPGVLEVFESLPQWLEGLSVEVAYQPVPPASLGDADEARMRRCSASHPEGATPGRWACERLLANAPDLAGEPQPGARDLSPARARAEWQEAAVRAAARGVTQLPAVEFDGQLHLGPQALAQLAQRLRRGAA